MGQRCAINYLRPGSNFDQHAHRRYQNILAGYRGSLTLEVNQLSMGRDNSLVIVAASLWCGGGTSGGIMPASFITFLTDTFNHFKIIIHNGTRVTDRILMI